MNRPKKILPKRGSREKAGGFSDSFGSMSPLEDVHEYEDEDDAGSLPR
jgi:hypothetical protein